MIEGAQFDQKLPGHTSRRIAKHRRYLSNLSRWWEEWSKQVWKLRYLWVCNSRTTTASMQYQSYPSFSCFLLFLTLFPSPDEILYCRLVGCKQLGGRKVRSMARLMPMSHQCLSQLALAIAPKWSKHLNHLFFPGGFYLPQSTGEGCILDFCTSSNLVDLEHSHMEHMKGFLMKECRKLVTWLKMPDRQSTYSHRIH